MKSEKGFTLIEVLVALAIASIIIVTIVASLGSGIRASSTTDIRETAKNVAESQMEYVYNQPFLSEYSPAPIGSEYPGYSAEITTAGIISRDGTIQRVTVIIELQDEEIMRLEGFKTK